MWHLHVPSVDELLRMVGASPSKGVLQLRGSVTWEIEGAAGEKGERREEGKMLLREGLITILPAGGEPHGVSLEAVRRFEGFLVLGERGEIPLSFHTRVHAGEPH